MAGAIRRRVAISAAALLVVVVVLAAVAHAPPVRARVLSWVIGQLETRYSLVMSADGIRYNLVTGDATLTNVRLAARGAETQPFFTASRVRADVPLATYAGRLILDEVEVDGGRVEILTDADGASNLPGGPQTDAPPPADPRRLNIRGLRLRDFTFVYDNRATPLRIDATGIDATLDHRAIRVFDGVTGPFAVRGGVDLQWRDRSLRVEPIDSRLAFDGSTVSLQDLPLVTSMGRLALSGRIHRVLDAPAMELTYEGEVDVAAAAAWAPPPMPVAGTARVQGSLTGPAGTLETAVRFDAESLRVGDERDLTVSGELLVDADGLTVNRILAAPASGGQVDAAVDMPFGAAPYSVSAGWQGVDARVFLRANVLTPPAVGARLDGRAQYRSGPRRTMEVRTDVAPIRERGVTPLDGRVSAGIDGDSWTLTHTLAAAGTTSSGTLTGDIDDTRAAGSSLRGRLDVTLTSLAAADRALAPHDIRVPAAVRDMSGAIDAEVMLEGTFSDWRATVLAHAPAMDLPGVGESTVSATIEATASRVLVAPLSLSRGSLSAGGEVAFDLDGRTITGAIHASVPDARDLQEQVPEAWRAAGALAADADLGGTFDEPTVALRVNSPALQLAGEVFEELDGRALVTSDGIEVSELTIRQAEGRLRATGRYGFDRTYTLRLDASDLSWHGVLAGGSESQVRLGGRFEGRGSLDEPEGDGRFGFAISGGVAGSMVGEGTLDVALSGDHASVHAIVPELGAFANGTITLAAPYDYRGVAVLNRVDLANIAPLLDAAAGQISGQLSLTAAVTGAAQGDAPPQVQANLQQLDALVAGVPMSLVNPTAISWAQGDLSVRDFAANLGTSRVTAYGDWAGRANTVFSGTFRGELAEVMQVAAAFGVETDVVARGRMTLDLFATGNRGDLIATLEMTDGYVEAAEGAVLTDLNLSAGITGEAFTLHALSAQADAARARGAFTATGQATVPDLDPMRAVGTFVVDQASFDSAGIEVKQRRPSIIAVANGVVSMEDVVWEAAGSALTVGGHVDLSGETPALGVTLTGVAVLRVLAAFVPDVGFDGTADVDVRVGGTLEAPDLSGTITLNEAGMALSSPRLVVSELSGPITLSGNRIELRGLTGTANGGTVAVDGGVVIDGLSIETGELYVQAAGVAVEYPRGLRSEVDALLTYSMSGPAPLLSGDVRVQRSAYTDPISLAALARANTAATVRPPEGGSAIDDLRLNITVTTVDDMRVDNNYGRFDAGAQLRLVGTVGRPGMSGQVTMREGGTFYAAGRTFSLTRGTVSFTNLTRIEPDLDIQAETRVSGQGTVTMTLQGTPDRFSFDLTSENEGTQEEIATALFGGGVSGANALTLLSSDLLGATGRQLGLDALRIDRGDVIRDEFREDPSALLQDNQELVTRLTLSKRLRDNIEFTLSQNLRENGKLTYIVSYYPIPNFELRAISRDDNTLGLGVRHQVTLGAEGTRRSTVERPVLRISGVRFEGEALPIREAELRDRVQLNTGELFDYYTWQRDLDELTGLFVERGYYEARVRGSRVEAGGGLLELVYTIARGPDTRIEIRGIQLPRRELNAMRDIWSRAVFDRFVVEDAETRVRRHLLAEGFVSGTVDGGMEFDDGTKTLRLTVAPGAPARDRTIRFQGNQGLSSRQLHDLVEAAGLGVQGWIDRQALAQTLTMFYRDEGYLKASIAVGEPVLEGATAVLPVIIEEGARAVIRRVEWTGVADERLEMVQAAADLSTGVPYALAAVDAARDRIDRRYRALGYNTAEVEAAATPLESSAEADVVFTIAEGPQQVLKEVVASGASRTREGVVNRALRLPVGQPVNAAEWSLARKRLFDTNVFRTVDIQSVPLGDPVDGVQQVRAVVTVEEYPPWRLRYGMQVDREREDLGENGLLDVGVGAIGEIRNQNLFGRAITGGAAARVERDFQRVNSFLQNPTFFRLPVRSSVFLAASRENLRLDGDVFAVTDIQSISFEQRWRRRLGVEFTYGYRFETNRTYDPDPDPEDDFPLDVTSNLARVTMAALLDRRDDPANATRGTFSSASLDQAARVLGSDARYGKLFAQQHLFLAVGPVVLASRVVAGDAYGPDELLPSDRFYAGGGNSVRGYAENGLGPRDLFGSPLGGSELLVMNQEARFPIYRWVRGVGFVDAGNVFSELSPFSLREMKVGYGAGLRVSSPIGILRIDFGLPASAIRTSNRRPNELGSGRWYFGLGHIF